MMCSPLDDDDGGCRRRAELFTSAISIANDATVSLWSSGWSADIFALTAICTHTHTNTKMGTNVWGGPAVLTVTWAAMMAMEDVMNGGNENGE